MSELEKSCKSANLANQCRLKRAMGTHMHNHQAHKLEHNYRAVQQLSSSIAVIVLHEEHGAAELESGFLAWLRQRATYFHGINLHPANDETGWLFPEVALATCGHLPEGLRDQFRTGTHTS